MANSAHPICNKSYLLTHLLTYHIVLLQLTVNARLSGLSLAVSIPAAEDVDAVGVGCCTTDTAAC